MQKLIDGVSKLGLHLDERQIGQFALYFQELVEWNQRMNLTRITAYEDVQVKHFLDSLPVALVLEQDIDYRLIDVGTGAGFPGIPLKIWSPRIRLSLLESTGKKTQFLAHLVEKLQLGQVEIINQRAEDAAHDPQYREAFDAAVGRGLAPMPVLTELTLPFCRTGGCLIAQKKGQVDAEVAAASRAIDVLGGKLRELKKIEIEEFGEIRWLVIVDKVAGTPVKYPRRPGIPAKRPLC